MRSLMGRVGVRVAVAAGLLLLILGVVSVARLAGGADRSIDPAAPQATVSLDPSAGDDGEVLPTPSAYADDVAVLTAARIFTTAWLRRDASPSSWHTGVASLSTDTLSASLEGVDPLSVPATRTTAEPTIVRRTDAFAQVSIAVDTGTLVLTLVRPESRWLVDGVDWDRV